jgi:osmotically inducible protein OsmC
MARPARTAYNDGMKRGASAVWQGGLKDGKGSISTESGALSEAAYGFGTRFETAPGTNPEELIAAAHAGCFSMALSGQLAEAKLTADSINTIAMITLDKTGPGWSITASHLDVRAKVPGANAASFQAAAERAKNGCPVSRLLGPAAKITMEARLV